MKDTIAESKIMMKYVGGELKPVDIEIGRPYQVSADEAACPIAMTGIYPKIHDIHGTDTLQALALALEFVRITIRKWEEKGFTFHFPDGELLPSAIWFDQKQE